MNGIQDPLEIRAQSSLRIATNADASSPPKVIISEMQTACLEE
jgi:hypothetical protein